MANESGDMKLRGNFSKLIEPVMRRREYNKCKAGVVSKNFCSNNAAVLSELKIAR